MPERGPRSPAAPRTPPHAGHGRAPAASARAGLGSLRALERRVEAAALGAASRLERPPSSFDEWESCLSWVPVTEYGDPDGGFGYRFGVQGRRVPKFRPALAIDRSEWDDPDYMFLAFVGGDRPGGEVCQDEPGEGID